MSKAGITVAIKGEINDLEQKIVKSKELITEAVSQIANNNKKLDDAQKSVIKSQSEYSEEIKKTKDEINKLLKIKARNNALDSEQKKELQGLNSQLKVYKNKQKEIVDEEKNKLAAVLQTVQATNSLISTNEKVISTIKQEISVKEKIIDLENQRTESLRAAAIAGKNKLDAEEKDIISQRAKLVLYTNTEKLILGYTEKTAALAKGLKAKIITTDEYRKSLKLLNEEIAKSTGVESLAYSNKAISGNTISKAVGINKTNQDELNSTKALTVAQQEYNERLDRKAKGAKAYQEQLAKQIAEENKYTKAKYETVSSLLAQRRAEEKNIEKLKETFDRTYKNTQAQNSYNDAVKHLNTLKTAGIISGNDFNSALKKEKDALVQSDIAAKNKEKSTSNLANTTIRYLRWAGTIAGVVYGAKRAWDLTVGSGIAVNKMIEDNTSGIAALLSANTRMSLSNGQIVNSYEKFQIAGVKATSIMEELRVASTKTYATFPQLTGIYQQMIGHTMSMGDRMGTTVDDISKNTIELSKILSNIGGAIGMEMQKVNEEARSIISGSASTDSLIAMMVFGSPTQANEAMKKAKERGTNGVKDMLMGVLDSYKVLEGVKTYTRAQLELQDQISRSQELLSKPTYNALKDVYMDLSVALKQNEKDFKEWGERLIEGAKFVVEYGDDIAKLVITYKTLDLAMKTSSAFAAGLGATNAAAALTFSGMAIPIGIAVTAYIAYNELIGKVLDKEERLAKIRGQKLPDLNSLSTTSIESDARTLQTAINDIIDKRKELSVVLNNEKNKWGLRYSEEDKKAAREADDLAKKEYEKLLQEKQERENLLKTRKEILETAQKALDIQNKEADLIVKIGGDTKILEDQKDFLKKNEEEIVGLTKKRKEWSDDLLKNEKNLAEVKQNQPNDIEQIAALEKLILGNKTSVLALDKEIAEVNKKTSDKTISSLESETNKKKQQNKLDAESKALKLELSMLQSGQIDEERLKISLLELTIKGREEEAKYLQEGIDKDKLLIQNERDKLYLKKLQNDEIEKQQNQYKFDQISGSVKYSDMENLGQVYQELLVYYKEDPESLADLETWVEREQNKLSKKPLVIDIKLQGWDEVSNSIATFGNSFQDINKAQKKYQQENEKVKKDEVALNQARVDLKDTTISGIADMTGAIASFYDEDDSRRKKQLELQKFMNATKMAMQLAELAQTITVETAKGQLLGTNALIAQLQLPFPANIPAYAMVAGMLASLGIMIGGSTKTSTTSDAFSAMEANTGTGSTLGDSTKQSESITKAMEVLKDYAKPEYQTLLSMNKYLANISNSIGGVTSLLIQSGGFAFGEGFTATDSGWKNNIGGGTTSVVGLGANAVIGAMGASSAMGTIYAAAELFGTGATSALVGGINAGLTAGLSTAAMGALAGTGIGIATMLADKFLLNGIISKGINSIVGGIFGKKKTTQALTDSGIYFADELLKNAIEAFNGSAYQTITTTTTKKSWFSKSSSSVVNSYFEDLDSETERQFSLVLSGIYNTVLASGDALDASASTLQNQLDNFVVSIGKISLKGKTGDEIQESLTAVFGKVSDDIAKATFPLLTPFQKVGEGLFTTLTRVSTGMEEAEYYIERLGTSFQDLSYTDIINKQGDIGFEALLQSIIKTDEAVYGLDNNLVNIIGNLDSTAEELYGVYIALDGLRNVLKFLKLDTDAVSYASIRGAGSAEALAQGMESYIEGFLTDAQQLALSTNQLQIEFNKLNVAMPTNKEAFTELIESLDLSSEAGQELYGRLIILSESFAKVSDDTTSYIATLEDSLKTQQDTYKKVIYGISAIGDSFLTTIDNISKTIDTLLGSKTGANKTQQQIQSYFSTKSKVESLLSKGPNLTTSEAKELNNLTTELSGLATNIQSGYTDNTVATNELVSDLSDINSRLDFSNQILQVNIVDGLSDMLGMSREQAYQLKYLLADTKLTNAELNSIAGLTQVQKDGIVEFANNSTYFSTEGTLSDLATYSKLQLEAYQKAQAEEIVGLSRQTLTYGDYIGTQEKIDIAKTLGVSYDTAKPLISSLQNLSTSTNPTADIKSMLGYSENATSYDTTMAAQLSNLSPYIGSVDISSIIGEIDSSTKSNTAYKTQLLADIATKTALLANMNSVISAEDKNNYYTSQTGEAWTHFGDNKGIAELAATLFGTKSSGYKGYSKWTGSGGTDYDIPLTTAAMEAKRDSIAKTIEGLVNIKNAKGYKVGGYTGDGSVDEIAGYTHRKEFVVNAPDLQAIGGPNELKNMIEREKRSRAVIGSNIGISNSKNDIINKLVNQTNMLQNGFNIMINKLTDIVDFNEERKATNFQVQVSGTVKAIGA